jgi:uncharacterized protein (TIGR02466 family)
VLKQVLARELFSSPLRGFDVPDAGPLNEELLAAIEARRQSEAGVKISNEFGWHSVNDLFKRPEPVFKKIAGYITNALLFTIRQTTPGFDLAVHDVEGEGWTNVSGKGAFNTPHAHGEFLWSGVYYVNTPETSSPKSGMLEFIDPRRGANVGGRLRPAIFSPKFQIKPRSGLMLIFPSYLLHWVYPNQEESPRVSLAFNAKIVSRDTSRLTEPT